MKLNMDLKKYIRSIPDYPKKGILFRDITTLIKNPEALNFTINKIAEISKKIEFDKVSAIESRGFIFASTVSYLSKKPLILFRKKINYLLIDTLLIFNWSTGKQQLRFTKIPYLKEKKS